MSDSVAVLMPIHSNPYVTVFPPPPCDPDYVERNFAGKKRDEIDFDEKEDEE